MDNKREGKSMTSTNDSAASVIEIDLDRAEKLLIPDPPAELEPAGFAAGGKSSGWSIRFPGGRPIATPAYEDGLLFLGGGYGSYEFYALEALTGRVVWRIRTADDGPTAAVVEDGLVAFNTESCTVVVCEAKTGRIRWQEWLGDPLMSQPAIANGRLFLAYPANQNRPLLRPEMTLEQQRQAIAEAKKDRGRGPFEHRLLCADLNTGRHIWEQTLTAEVITAPVIDGDEVFLTCFDGVSFCLKAADGAVVWRKQSEATSAPLVVEGQVIMTEKLEEAGEIREGLRRHRRTGEDLDRDRLLKLKAAYFQSHGGGGSSIKGDYSQQLDSSVGFGAAPAAANLGSANEHLGVSTVAGAWSYQGSRSSYSRHCMYNAQSRFVRCVRDDAAGSAAWTAEAGGAQVAPDDQVFLPPAMGLSHLYLATTMGHFLSLRQDDGRVGLLYALGRPIAFQPCLARGRAYLGALDGRLICIDTGDADADGWYMWGGNARHNKRN